MSGVPDLPLKGKIFLLLTSAGASSRFGGEKKEFLDLGGRSVLQTALDAFLHLSDLAGIVITYPADRLAETRESLDSEILGRLEEKLPAGLRFVQGGETRQASVSAGLSELTRAARSAALDPEHAIVLIHDAARPWVSASIIDSVVESTRKYGACLPLCDVADTPKIVSPQGLVSEHPERNLVKAAQTPQGFSLFHIALAHEKACAEAWSCTDDTSLWARYVGPVAYVQGDRKNRKITYREDMGIEKGSPEPFGFARIGEGWDVHTLVKGRPLMLGGIHVEHDKGELGHSDGDVLWHAIIDSLLGAAALGDIGTHFPPSDLRWKDANSSDLAAKTARLIEDKGWRIVNLDASVILEKPKLGPWKDDIRKKVAKVLGIDFESVSIKAKTYEGLGAVGKGEAVEARAVVLLAKKA